MNNSTREEVERWMQRLAYLALFDENERLKAVVEVAREFVDSERTRINHARGSQKLVNLYKALAKLDGGSDE